MLSLYVCLASGPAHGAGDLAYGQEVSPVMHRLPPKDLHPWECAQIPMLRTAELLTRHPCNQS